MEMISPSQYVETKKTYSIDELKSEKLELLKTIYNIKEDIVNNVPDFFMGGRETKLKMYESYLEELEKLIEQKKDCNGK